MHSYFSSPPNLVELIPDTADVVRDGPEALVKEVLLHPLGVVAFALAVQVFLMLFPNLMRFVQSHDHDPRAVGSLRSRQWSHLRTMDGMVMPMLLLGLMAVAVFNGLSGQIAFPWREFSFSIAGLVATLISMRILGACWPRAEEKVPSNAEWTKRVRRQWAKRHCAGFFCGVGYYFLAVKLGQLAVTGVVKGVESAG